MTEDMKQLIEIANNIQSLLELLAEDKIAERDAKHRAKLREIVGTSVPMQKSIYLMDGTRTQKEIRDITSANQGHLSTLVGRLQKASLLTGEPKLPKLSISIPPAFFANHDQSI